MKKGVGAGSEWPLWGLCAGAVGVSFFLAPSALPDLDLCWFKALTHHPCPGCGLTHAFLAIGHGQWAQAWAANPFGFVWFALALYVLLRPFLRLWNGRAVERTDGLIVSQYFFPALVILMVLVWAWRSFV